MLLDSDPLFCPDNYFFDFNLPAFSSSWEGFSLSADTEGYHWCRPPDKTGCSGDNPWLKAWSRTDFYFLFQTLTRSHYILFSNGPTITSWSDSVDLGKTISREVVFPSFRWFWWQPASLLGYLPVHQSLGPDGCWYLSADLPLTPLVPCLLVSKPPLFPVCF